MVGNGHHGLAVLQCRVDYLLLVLAIATGDWAGADRGHSECEKDESARKRCHERDKFKRVGASEMKIETKIAETERQEERVQRADAERGVLLSQHRTITAAGTALL